MIRTLMFSADTKKFVGTLCRDPTVFPFLTDIQRYQPSGAYTTVYQHSLGVALLAKTLAERLGLNEQEQAIITAAALLHDYGKIGIELALLEKPTNLNDNERKRVKEHARLTITSLQRKVSDTYLAPAAQHHEWDKNFEACYPRHQRRKEDQKVSLQGQVIAIADQVAALTEGRNYLEPQPKSAVEEQLYLHFAGDSAIIPEVLQLI